MFPQFPITLFSSLFPVTHYSLSPLFQMYPTISFPSAAFLVSNAPLSTMFPFPSFSVFRFRCYLRFTSCPPFPPLSAPTPRLLPLPFPLPHPFYCPSPHPFYCPSPFHRHTPSTAPPLSTATPLLLPLPFPPPHPFYCPSPVHCHTPSTVPPLCTATPLLLPFTFPPPHPFYCYTPFYCPSFFHFIFLPPLLSLFHYHLLPLVSLPLPLFHWSPSH